MCFWCKEKLNSRGDWSIDPMIISPVSSMQNDLINHHSYLINFPCLCDCVSARQIINNRGEKDDEENFLSGDLNY